MPIIARKPVGYTDVKKGIFFAYGCKESRKTSRFGVFEVTWTVGSSPSNAQDKPDNDIFILFILSEAKNLVGW